MTTVSTHTTRAAAVSAPVAATQSGAEPSTLSLLSAPATLSSGDLGDGMTAVYEMMARRNDGEVVFGKANVETKSKQSDAAKKREQDAIAKEDYDRTHKSFWDEVKDVASTVGEIAGVVAGVAACVVTGGAAAPLIVAIAAIVLSAGGTLVAKTGILGEYSKEIGMGMALAGTALSLGTNVTGVFSAAGTATETAKAATTAVKITKTAMQTTRTVADVTSFSASGVALTAGLESSHYEAAGEDAHADATQARQTIQRMQRETDQVIGWLKEANDSNRTAMKTIHGAMQTLQQTQTASTSFGARA